MHQFKDVVVQMIGGNNCEQKPGSLEVRSLEVRSLEVFLLAFIKSEYYVNGLVLGLR